MNFCNKFTFVSFKKKSNIKIDKGRFSQLNSLIPLEIGIALYE